MAVEATSRLALWVRLLESFGRLLVRLVWVAVILVVLAAAGQYLWMRAMPRSPPAVKTSKPIVQPSVPWSEVDQALAAALEQSRRAAEREASQRLDEWIAGLMQRVDDDFLPWYFSYWNQQRLGLESLYQEAVHWVNGNAPTAAEKITEEVQRAFAEQVLRPEIAQLELESLVRQVVNGYVENLRQNLDAIPKRYSIPQAEWQRYLSDLGSLSAATEGNRQVDLSLKTVVVGTGAAGAVVLAKSINLASAKLGAKVSGTMAGDAVAQMAGKTGAKVAAKAGGKLLGPIIGVGILVWDLWDHYQTREESLPVMRQNIQDYLGQMKISLLEDSEAGVMAPVRQLENGVLNALANQHGHSD